MRRRALLAGGAGLLGASALASPAAAAAGPDAAGRHVPLRVATYNIQAGAGADRRFDLARQIAAMRELDADILGLQEVDVHWSARSEWRHLARELATALRMRVFYAPIYSLDPLEAGKQAGKQAGKPRREFGIAMLSRYPILRATNHEITRLSTQEPNPTPKPAPGFPEIVVNVRGAHVHVYGTHLDYRGDPAVRIMQVADMLRIMGDNRKHAHQHVMLGDLNARPDAPELAPLFECLTDAWAVTNGPGGETYPANAPDRRIDYVSTSRNIRIRAVRSPHTLASDHLPVVADLTVTRGHTA